MKMGFAILVLFVVSAANADTVSMVRATELTPKVMDGIQKGTIQDLIIEFRQGDRLPVTFQAEGDFLETSQVAPSYVVVKRAFWLRVDGNHFEMSLDGLNYRNLKDLVTGQFTASSSDSSPVSGTANAINLLLQAYLKN